MRYVMIVSVAVIAAAFATPAASQMADACYAECQAMQTERDALYDAANTSAATSGGTTQQIDALDDAIAACNTRCDELSRIQEEFKACIARVNAAVADPKIELTPEEIEFEMNSCRNDYRYGKDNFHRNN